MKTTVAIVEGEREIGRRWAALTVEAFVDTLSKRRRNGAESIRRA